MEYIVLVVKNIYDRTYCTGRAGWFNMEHIVPVLKNVYDRTYCTCKAGWFKMEHTVPVGQDGLKWNILYL